jgi:frataxin-like iron-binding protein CyaY
MTYRTAQKLVEAFTLDDDYNLLVKGKSLSDGIAKAYVYANMFFYDEVEKEIRKLEKMVKKIHDEVTLDLGIQEEDPMKIFFEISTRAHRQIGDDGLDMMIKEFLTQKAHHIALMVDQREKNKFHQICEAIFTELTEAFYNMTLQTAVDYAPGVKTFKFTPEFVNLMTERQKTLVAPTLRIIALEHNVMLSNLQISSSFTVKYSPAESGENFLRQEDAIKETIKKFVQENQ